MDLKYQISHGDIQIPNPKKALIGAHIAQAELGDFLESSGMVYPPYFPSWDSGISHIIRKEHRKLKGENPSPPLPSPHDSDFPLLKVLQSAMLRCCSSWLSMNWRYMAWHTSRLSSMARRSELDWELGTYDSSLRTGDANQGEMRVYSLCPI